MILGLSKEGASRKKMAMQEILSFLPVSFAYWLSSNEKIKGNLMIFILWTLWNYWCKFIAGLIMSFVAWICVALDSNSKWSGVLSLDSDFYKFLPDTILTTPLSLFLGFFSLCRLLIAATHFVLPVLICAINSAFFNFMKNILFSLIIGCFSNISHLWIIMLFINFC